MYPAMMTQNLYDLIMNILIRPKKKMVMLPSPDQNLKIGSVG